MPTYLCHGFRWQRRSIRVYVVVQDLDDAAPEWIIKQGSARNLIESFYNLFDFLPDCTFPPTRSSSRTPGFRSISQSVSQSSMYQAANKDDDDDASYHTTRSSRSRGRSSPNGSTSTLQQQSSHTWDSTRPVARRPSSNSSRKRSEAAGPSNAHALSSRAALPFQAHHCPPSPPASQPGFNPAFQPSDPSDPVLAQNWSPVKLLEEYDPANIEEVSRPYAYVSDYVTRINDSCSIVEEIQRYEARVRRDSTPPVTGASSDDMLNGKRDTSKLGRRAGWFEKLRDQLQRGEDIRWYVVVIGDEERAWPVEETQGSASRSSVVHHKQYTHQQLIFEAQDQEMEARREQLRKELGFEQGGVDRLMERRLERRPNPPQKESLPPLRTKVSIMSQIVSASPKSPKSPKTPKSPKSPGRTSLRRLFSRGKTEEGTTT
ncbi:hypothetical protein N0V93_007779 [Gnomoniopsis smithogilvyi]|uniref:Developmental regulator n=1 Tax=Gnomoniopsis smithogilvyi TaxID=1191159 RepID=A0A9W8YNS4_9PEZI|nr:hypothetical protein N0V93_007779 [Gnomoniopsis smithogilvyi]